MADSQHAAVTIQLAFRCFRARTRYFEMLGGYDGTIEEEELPSLATGDTVQHAAQDHQDAEQSAVILQNAFRCHTARSVYYELLGLLQLSPEEREQLNGHATMGDTEACALRIQLAFRCFLAKNVYYELLGQEQAVSDHQDQDLQVESSQIGEHHEGGTEEESKQRIAIHSDDSVQQPVASSQTASEASQKHQTEHDEARRRDQAANCLQCAFRCFRARGRYYELLGQTQGPEEESEITSRLPGEDVAATMIQCAIRSHQARKAHTRLGSNGRQQNEAFDLEQGQALGADVRMEKMMREAMALISSAPQLASLESLSPAPELQELIERAIQLWTELGEENATAQVMALQASMDEGEAQLLQQMVDMVVQHGESEGDLVPDEDAIQAITPTAQDTGAPGPAIDKRLQLLIQEGVAILSDASAREPGNLAAAAQTPQMQAMIENAIQLWVELGEEQATAQVIAFQDTMGDGEAQLLQQMVDMVVQQGKSTALTPGPVVDERLRLLIQEGVALLSDAITSEAGDFAAAAQTPQMQAMIENAIQLWAELGEEQATAQVIAFQDTMGDGEAQLLQQMVDMVVMRGASQLEALEQTEMPPAAGEDEALKDVTASEAAADDAQVDEESQAAVKIQARARGMRDRRRVREGREGQEDGGAEPAEEESVGEEEHARGGGNEQEKAGDAPEEDAAATRIQAAARGRRDRKQVQELRRRESAVTVIQSAVRARAARQVVHAARSVRAAEDSRRTSAAAVVQGAERGRRARAEVRARGEREARKVRSAGQIQAAVRGHRGRAEAKRAREQQKAEAARRKAEGARDREMEELRRMVAEVERKQAEEAAVREAQRRQAEVAARERLEREASESRSRDAQEAASEAADAQDACETRSSGEGEGGGVESSSDAAAATKIQAVVRGRQDRQRVESLREAREDGKREAGSLEDSAEELIGKGQTVMARLPSGMRRQLQQALATGDSELAALIREVCALALQCAARGRAARRRMRERMAEVPTVEAAAGDGVWQAAVAEAAEWERRAAVEEQALERGEGEERSLRGEEDFELWDAGERKPPWTEEAEGEEGGNRHSVRVEREKSGESGPRLSSVHVISSGMARPKSTLARPARGLVPDSPPQLDRAARVRAYSEAQRRKLHAAAERAFSPPGGAPATVHPYLLATRRFPSPIEQRADGQVVIRYDNGDSYQGGFLRGSPEGFGTFEWREGDRYCGEWKAGKRHGQGEYDWADGSKFTGWWIHGKQHGKGIFEWPDGRTYEGNWEAKLAGAGRQSRQARERRVYGTKPKMFRTDQESSLASWTPMRSSPPPMRSPPPTRGSPASVAMISRPSTGASQAETASPAGSRPITAEGRVGVKEEAWVGSKPGKGRRRVTTGTAMPLGNIRPWDWSEEQERGGGRAKQSDGAETLFRLLVDDMSTSAERVSPEQLDWDMENLETLYSYEYRPAFQGSPKSKYAPSSSSSVRRLYTALSASSAVADPLPLPRVLPVPGSPQGDPRPSIRGMMSEMMDELHGAMVPSQSPPGSPAHTSPTGELRKQASSPSVARSSPRSTSPSSLAAPSPPRRRSRLVRTESMAMLEKARTQEAEYERARAARSTVRRLLEQQEEAAKMGQIGDSELAMLFGRYSEGGLSDVSNGVMDQRRFLDCLIHLGLVSGAKALDGGRVERQEGVVKKKEAIDLFHSCRRASSRSVERHRLSLKDFELAVEKLNDILDGKCFQRLTPAALQPQSAVSPTAARWSAPAAAAGAPETKELHRMLVRHKADRRFCGWGMDVVARNRKKNLDFENPFHDPLFEFEQVRAYM